MTSTAERLIICDASPLILLAKIDCLHLVTLLAHEVWIPRAVWEEVTINGRNHPESLLIQKHVPANVRDPDPLLEAAYSLMVDRGEAAALALASHVTDPCLLMDDRKGRRVADARGWRCMGTLGLLVRSKKTGHIESLSPYFGKLHQANWFIDPALLNEALRAYKVFYKVFVRNRLLVN